MNEFIAYIIQFGNLNPQQIDLVAKKAKELEILKREVFSLKQVALWSFSKELIKDENSS